jgi:hypothetical protein
VIVRPRSWAALFAVLALVILAACAERSPVIPTGAGEPITTGSSVAAEVFGHCQQLSTLTAEIRLSGHAGRQKLRGRLIAGFSKPASIRLEAVAPFGPPVFILAATAADSTLILPRDARVMRQVPPADILEALAGISVPPSDLLPLLAGCVPSESMPADARGYGSDWVSLRSGAWTAYLQRHAERWQLATITGPKVMAEYSAFTGARAGVLRLRESATGTAKPQVDLSLALSQVELNVPVPAAAFQVAVPAEASPISLDELRQSGPMRDQPSRGGSQ